jgi:DNA polymerase III subunit beta
MSQTSITVNRAELGNALAFASLGLSRRPAVPVLAGMRVSITCGTLELSAFDYEIAARAKVSGEASGPGSILITGAELSAAVKSLPRGKAVTAQVTIGDDALIIECEGIVSTLGGFDAQATAEYPALPDMPELAGYVDAATFADSAGRVVPCAGTDDTLPVLTCVNITSEHNRLELTATDRYRLARHRVHWTGPDGIAALVSASTLAAFAKRCARDGKVEIYAGEKFAGFSDGAYALITSVNCGEFPRVGRMFVSEADTWVTVEASALAAAVTRAGKMAEPNAPVRLDVANDGSGARVMVQVVTDGRVVSSQAVPCRFSGPDAHTGFNAGYLASVLAGVGAGRARLGFSGTAAKPKPLQVRGTDGFAAVQMPIKIGG